MLERAFAPVSCSRICVTACAVLLLSTAFASAQEIRWRAAEAGLITKSSNAGQSPMEAISELAARPNAKRVVVTLNQPVDDDLRARLDRAGVTLLSYLSDHSFFATVHADQLNTGALAQTDAMLSVEAIDPAVKLHPMLAEGKTPAWAVVGAAPDDSPVIGTYVLFHRDVDLYNDAIPLMEMYQGEVRDVLESINALVVELPKNVIQDLATEDNVQWIEQALPKLDDLNNSNRARVQADTAQSAPYSLNGAGVKVLVYDGGTARASHNDFGGRLSVHDGSGQSYHATHVAGTIGGSGVASGGTYKGMAPGVTMFSYGFEWNSSGVFLYNNPGDLEDDYSEAINVRGAHIANNSIGTNTALYWDCAITGDYGITSQLIDKIVRGDGSDPQFDAPFRIVWANGNERQTSRCGSTYYTTAPPACAKNHITVGALNSNNDSMTSFSSWGPSDDNRMKPDISAPGCQSNDDNGVTSCDNDHDNDYYTLCGTSMAAPTVTGICALIMQDYRNQFPALDDPRNSTLKILLAHNAIDLGNTGPDNQFGYGSVRVADTIDNMRLGHFFEDQVSQGDVVSYQIEVSGGTAELKVTMAWDDFPGTPNVNPALVNDLDLHVYDPSGGRHYPWTLSAASPGNAAVRTQEDHVNNIEQVVVDNPTSGTWTVEVRGFDVPEGPQPFSVCASPNLSQGAVCPGDLDGDGFVNLSDLSILLANYPTAGGAAYEDGDLDGDGDVDLSDLSMLLALYPSACN